MTTSTKDLPAETSLAGVHARSLSGIGLLCVLLVVAGVAVPAHATPGPAAATPTETATPNGSSAGTDSATVVFYDQESSGDALVVARANLSDGGFVAVFDGSRNGTLLGTSAYLVPGSYRNVDVNLTTGFENDTTTVAVLYRDVDDNRTFDRAVDEPYRRDGAVVSDTAYVTSARAPGTVTATETLVTATETATPTAVTTATDSEAPGFGALAALAALLLVTALRRRN